MKHFIALMGLLLCFTIVSCRHYNAKENTEESSDETEHIAKAREFAANQMRHHRRKRWQSNYGYDYPPPPPYPLPYYPDRRDYDRNNQDLLPQILRLLDEISSYIKRPPPPPQPIYVPYPVPYPVPQVCSCAVPTNGSKNPNVDKRLRPTLEDSNQNWGLVDSNDDADYEDGGDGSRPISFDPIKPKYPMQRPPPKVDHGSTQEDRDLSTQASAPALSSSPKAANMCNIAILSCCSGQQQRTCFTKFGCGMTYAKGNACTSDSINTALDSFKSAYAPTF
nr:putative silk protein 2 [Ephestia kuehniella]